MEAKKIPDTDLDRAWEEFTREGRICSGQIRPEILTSWHRCLKARVDPQDGACHYILDGTALQQTRIRHQTLIDTAKPFINKLYDFVAGSGLIVFLSDASGTILESVGDCDVASNASKVNLVTGTTWKEEDVGTNGIGTALKIKGPIQISGKEHYCAKLHAWTCSAAPIFNPEGRITGVLQMSGPSHAVHLHTLGMIVAAVEAIESHLRINQKTRELIRLNNSLNNIFQIMSDGAVITDRSGIISQINPMGEKILGSKARGTAIRKILGDSPGICDAVAHGRPFSDVELMVDTAGTRLHCLVSAKPIRDGKNAPNGAVIFFNPINKVKNLINRFSSAQASFHFSDIIGESPSLATAIKLAEQAAPGTSNILITGESGTGKELFAQSIHNKSQRQSGPFIALNCAALPRELIASELFGYADGAFTGAKKGGRPGKFEMAAGGTLFLDEIGDMPLDQQAILLRVLQGKKIFRIGGDHAIPVDVRIICATHKDLRQEVEKKNFRADLYYRLNVILVTVPPLRSRPQDIQPLFFHLLKKICTRQNISVPRVDPAVLVRLEAYGWPGNVRELENVVEKLISADHGNPLLPDHLPDDLGGETMCPAPCQRPPLTGGSETRNMAGLMQERERLVELLAQHRGNISQVAREMHVSRNTIYRKLKFYRISQERAFG